MRIDVTSTEREWIITLAKNKELELAGYIKNNEIPDPVKRLFECTTAIMQGIREKLNDNSAPWE